MSNAKDHSCSIPDKQLSAPNVILKQGTLLKQRYKIERPLAEGGMGRVYQAFDVQASRRVAIKQLLTKLDGDNTEIAERFRREYCFLNSIDHVNLIKVYELFTEDNTQFLVQEFAEGVSLKQLLQEQPHSLSLIAQIAIGNQIARAVEVLNTAGILHRDIKPGNIMLNRATGCIKLLDLGLGKAVSKEEDWALTQRGAVLGTLEYLSPEQANGEISAVSDVFSLGVTLYQLLLWEPHSPFKNANTVTILMEIMTKELPLLSEQVKRRCRDMGWALLPEEKLAYQELSPIVAKALTKDADNRSSAGAIADELEHVHQSLCAALALPEKSDKETGHWNVTVRANGAQIENLQKLGEKYGRDEAIEKRPRRVSRRLNAASRRYTPPARVSLAKPAAVMIGSILLLGLVAAGYYLWQDKDNTIAALKQENQKLLKVLNQMQKNFTSDIQREVEPLKKEVDRLQQENAACKTESNRLEQELNKSYAERVKLYERLRAHERGSKPPKTP
jgi:serine/threonine protein kinase